MSDSDDHEPGAAWTGRRITMSSPINHRTGLSVLGLVLAAAGNLLVLIGSITGYNGVMLWLALIANAVYFASIAYVVRDHDRIWGVSPLDTSRKGGRD